VPITFSVRAIGTLGSFAAANGERLQVIG